MFQKHYANFPSKDRLKIAQFIHHLENFGFDGLKGRNKSSADVSVSDPDWSSKLSYAKTHHLWHYHIGIPDYQLPKQGDHTSEYVLHYVRYDDEIILVDMSPHPPFALPSIEYLQ